jgi:GMP synthase-like glutamine amidotransferase
MLQKQMGLLVCDNVYESYRTKCPDFLHMYSEAFPQIDFIPYHLHRGEFPSHLENLSGYMMTGSRYSAYDEEEWIIRAKQLIRDIKEADLLFVGICFGHQMIAEALGGEVKRAPVGWSVGIQSFEITNYKNWMRKKISNFNVQMMCQDQVHKLPKDTEIIAFRPECPVGIMQIGKKILGIQGHPEFPSAYAEALIRERKERIGIMRAEKALKTISQNLETNDIREIVQNFVHYHL